MCVSCYGLMLKYKIQVICQFYIFSLLFQWTGSFVSGTNCLLCDYGYYQPARQQEYCIQCGTNLNTSSKGASKQEECQRK